MAESIRLPDVPEQQVLKDLKVRLITPEERPRWNELVSTYHYLKNATLVGEQLHYVVEYQGNWLALLGWSAAARHLRPRDAWIGWDKGQLCVRRHLLANNARFCILADAHQLPNLASRALALCCSQLAQDWQRVWGHPILAVESFVDGQLFRGTAYKAAGWTRLDDTSGFARVAEDFYERHDRPKQLWVRALEPTACRWLSATTLPPSLAAFEKPTPVPPRRCHVPTGRLASLLQELPRQVADPRSKRGRFHSWRAVLGIVVLAKLCGTLMGQRHIAEFARLLSKPQRRALGCRRDPDDPQHYVVPSESTYQRALAVLDFAALEPLMLRWQDLQLGQADTDLLIAIDGKHVRRSGGLAIASAISQPSQRVIATKTMKKHESEITAVRQLLENVELSDQLLGLDSLHTQRETIHQILYDKGADYLVPIKRNQPTMLASARTFLPEDFPP